MGCITGLIAKIFLTAFNAAVALTGVAVLSLGAIVITTLNKYGDQIPDEPYTILTGLESVSGFVICLGILGVLTVCCCSNKLFLYTYTFLGICLVIVTITFASIGTSDINKGNYQRDIRKLMNEDITNYSFSVYGDEEKKLDGIYQTNECCGVDSYSDWKNKTSGTSTQYQLANGCCIDIDGAIIKGCYITTARPDLNKIYPMGCYKQLVSEVGDAADASVKLGVFFGLLLLALIISTMFCVKCTDALPI